MNIRPVNENSFILYFGDTICIDIADKIGMAVPIIRQALKACLIDIVPSYTSILVTIDILQSDVYQCIEQLSSALGEQNRAQTHAVQNTGLIEIPVYYGPEVALDSETVCTHTGLTFEEIIAIHSAETYRVYAIGFTPGFAYLGNTDPRIDIPRKKTPRLAIPKGSVALADRQTAIYPKMSPGGWQIIGKTPMDLIDYHRDNLTLFEMGAKVSFTPISRQEFIDLGGELTARTPLRTKGGTQGKKLLNNKEIAGC